MVLASVSPRRRELLRQVGFEFEVVAPEVPETQGTGEDAAELALRHARAKALAVAERTPARLVLGADTVVVLGKRILGKPAGADEAREMLRSLSGRRHEVVTAVVIAAGEAEGEARVLAEDVVVTAVTFRELSEREIEDYVACGEPMDKAGAYGIQGRGALLVARVDGCYFNVVGLPLARVGEMLAGLCRTEQRRAPGESEY
ncbi:MAG: septum formation inhibitor Maf [Armatimonadetes bacterium]|nr:septum formation inhibitor Maf [Armatimonadota bacterium]